MKYLSTLFLFIFCFAGSLFSQSTGDSVSHTQDSIKQAAAISHQRADSAKRIQRIRDSLLLQVQKEITRAADTLKARQEIARRKKTIITTQELLRTNPNFNFFGKPDSLIIEHRKSTGNEGLFYYILSLILYIALIRLFFYKYITTLFTLFFRATLRQQQLREQLLQAPLPALLLNIFFVTITATYCTFLAKYFNLSFGLNFWTTLLYAFFLIAVIYITKYILLTVAGWIFGISNVTDTYIFIVFLINKMLAIFLLPVLVMLAFPNTYLLPVILVCSYILIFGMLFYRFIISYRPVRNEIKLNRFHFFLYLCAFEIAPLLLIYKVLLTFVDSSL